MEAERFTQFHPGKLPLFRAKLDDSIVLYAPGHIAVVTPDEMKAIQSFGKGLSEMGNTGASALVEHAFATERFHDSAACLEVAVNLEEYARHVVEDAQERIESAFAPECLTLYLSNRCNLSCPYCYAAANAGTKSEALMQAFGKGLSKRGNAGESSPAASSPIDEQVVDAAARLVAGFCAEKGKPFNLVLHGGGEPAFHWELVQRIVANTRRISDEFGLDWSGYIATNGVMSAERARWLAERFSYIGLSCDGPPDVQDQQRPLRNGGRSSPFVERTARVLKESGGRFNVRTTITPQTVSRQSEIVVYLHERLGATEIRFEPVYLRGTGQGGFIADHADLFAQCFLEAQRTAQELECELSFSGVRLDEIHGPYCNILRDVLNLTPDGMATACFVRCRGDEPGAAPFIVGQMDDSTGEFVIHHKQVAELRRLLGAVPDRCLGCVNAYHCARGCPEICQITVPVGDQEPGFRCLVNRKLAETWILEAARSIGRRDKDQYNVSDGTVLGELLADAPSHIDMEAIRCQWRAADPLLKTVKRSLPSPIWAQRGYTRSGMEAWGTLCQELESVEPDRALSVYFHIPFCHHKCAFCDCYSRVLSSRSRSMEADYGRALLKEMELWSSLGTLAERPVTTVHFGGGTPNYLSSHVFGQIVGHCAACFGTTPQTEWAIESTSSLLTDDHLEELRNLGFTRLHVGVQTLEDQVRKLIRRRESSYQVLRRIDRALSTGFIVSADIIYGLPGESMAGFAASLKRLMDTGVHGFSLYQLQTSSQNRRFLERYGVAEREPVHDYVFLQVAEQLLKMNGYRKTYFNHFARLEDHNLYYSFPERGEDLLALGTTADGVFGDYHYRHTGYDDYVSGAMQNMPSLEGGVRETHAERELKPAVIMLLAGYMKTEILQELDADWLLERWLEDLFLESSTSKGLKSLDERSFILTANGSWFITYMIQQLTKG